MALLSAAVGPFAGVGLFTGCTCSMRLLPGKPGSGLRVQRLSFDQVATQRALAEHVARDSTWAGPAAPLVRNTTLLVSAQPGEGVAASDATKVAATIEHVMSALAGLHVWDATIEINACEVPIFDGSAKVFVDALLPALRASDEPEPLRLTQRVEVREGDASIVAEPVASMAEATMTYNLDYGGRGGLGQQSATWDGRAESYARETAPARTFGLRSELQIARRMGQFAWLNESEMLVFDDTAGSSGERASLALRFANEPARHKLLDLIGDLALLGQPLQARVTATKSGHALTAALCRKIAAMRG